ncbi:HlyD family efflux transporter periplasmic adaptor subunit [Leptospira congkakensis]|uniref:HlyD family efflux transporter periplasmic adaptor subunit n=1 Tax=Leptospira congkakensis TaxID=2484932 RepID=A0A4Z1A1V4_9LEPT|nr:efflux RND transporter periplasmic adaptor subunit [Leptospira congkakensis]TGL85180.1 HlyD family efflux transporter periplasmic adaptor subunit [Leptospira congkakensis]TGL92890.1 HlyD family efflux transporter periplasmic adaptor subunit [Leptospira congkakensis]TGL95628.1 HlyD family efflux transporter periplasmic adaptor subunit [Leptospira congkakensis]
MKAIRLPKLTNTLAGAAIIVVIFSLTVWALNKASKPKPQAPKRPIIHDKGLRIELPAGSSGLKLIKSVYVNEGNGDFVNITAPARLIASSTPSVSSGIKVILFESAELNETYMSYQYSKNKLSRSRKALNRIEDMFKHRVATDKDVFEAETELRNDAAELGEFEGKLRAIGLNPNELGNAGSHRAWIISDVAESQLKTLKKGKKVRIIFNSFPNEVWEGIAEAIGDNVDPMTRTVKVRIAILNKDNKLKPGMYGVVQFPEETKNGSLVLPFTSIVTVEGHHYVFVEQTANNFTRTEVVLGISDKDRVNILEGITANDKVVVEGSILLKGLSFGF